ncbi:MAG: magnesium chelatase [Acidobacteria bacterium]|nr:magnesium chelatase [Acidobacteriota bacterium]
MSRPTTLGMLKREVAAGRVARRPVRAELRDNLLARLKSGVPLFPGVLGYDETVVPQVVNAILARHHFILLGLRGQAKSRLLRALTSLLDDEIPIIPGSEINDDPLAPLSPFGRQQVAEAGDDLSIGWLPREARYVEKLATPDVTIADMIGDIDPIKAARAGLALGDEFTMHYGLVPRANRGIFAINELPDLAGRIQVGLFNILQEGDVQIKGFPVRLPLDILLVFSANPEDYTARGKIITPLKDRIGSEIRTHYPATRDEGVAITEQEAWTARTGAHGPSIEVPRYIRDVVEEVAFQARKDAKVDNRSGVSQRLPITLLENVVSNAERRAVLNDESLAVPRVSDLFAALPSITGKLELEYEGELKGAAQVAADIIRSAVGQVFETHMGQVKLRQVLEWFDMGGSLQLEDTASARALLDGARKVLGLTDLTDHLGVPEDAPAPLLASAVDFVLEGMHAQKKISRSDAGAFVATDEPVRRGSGKAERRRERQGRDDDDDSSFGGGGRYN